MFKSGPQVLYVEDDDDDRFFMCNAFKEAGLEGALHILRDGRDAIEYLAGDGIYADRVKHPIPDLVLLDLNLPQVSGFEVLVWIRKQPQYALLPVVTLSSSMLESDMAAVRLLGSSEYCVKPVSGRMYNELALRLRDKWLAKFPGPLSPIPPAGNGGRQ